MTKYALCVGINEYPNAPLSGCVNDAHDWGAALTARGFLVEYLLDGAATMQGIKERVNNLVTRAKWGDRIVWQYSGHGTYRPDDNGDEPDKQDEAICPVDYDRVGMLYDDEIGAILGRARYGVRVLQISDSCFSGSVSRFAGLPTRNIPRFIPPHRMPFRAKPRDLVAGRPHLLMSGATDTEYAWDAWFGTRPNGAFTRAALDTLAHAPKTYQNWQAMIRTQLPSEEYPQTPLLEGSWYRRHWATLA